MFKIDYEKRMAVIALEDLEEDLEEEIVEEVA